MTSTPASSNMYFNPRPPRGGRLQHMIATRPTSPFQSTPPARGATALSTICAPCCIFQSTPPARGATVLQGAGRFARLISIHAPREGGDPVFVALPAPSKLFQSTPPARGATANRVYLSPSNQHFNPRPPRGGRPRSGDSDRGQSRISIHAPREGGDACCVAA